MSGDVVLHIGLQRTGTTSIQETLDSSSNDLRRSGVNYLWSGRHRHNEESELSAGHHELAWALRGGSGPVPTVCRKRADMDVWIDALEEMEQQPDACHVISSEDLWLATSRQIQLLRRLLADRDARVVVYLREPDAWLASRYRHEVRREQTASTYGQFLSNIRDQEATPEHQVRLWADEFDVTVRRFEDVRGDVVGDFCRHLGIDADDIDRAAHRNASLTDDRLAQVRVLNRVAQWPVLGPRTERIRRSLRSDTPSRRVQIAGKVLWYLAGKPAL